MKPPYPSTGFNLIEKKLIVISSIFLRIHFHPFNQVKLHLIWSLFPICKSNQCLKPSLYLSARGNISIIQKIEIWSIYHWNKNINININSKPMLTSLWLFSFIHCRWVCVQLLYCYLFTHMSLSTAMSNGFYLVPEL